MYACTESLFSLDKENLLIKKTNCWLGIQDARWHFCFVPADHLLTMQKREELCMCTPREDTGVNL